MTGRQRSAVLGFLFLLGCLAATMDINLRSLWAGPLLVPGQTTQSGVLGTPEPPLADGVPRPATPPALAPTPPAPAPEGTLNPVDPPVPTVSLRVRVPASVSVGREIEYRICVQNTSRDPRAAAHHVQVRNPLPVNARFVRAEPPPTAREPDLLWQLDTLEPGKCREITLVLAPTAPGDVKNCARVQFEHGECVTTRVAGPELALRKVGPAQAQLYDSLTYTLFVTNTGGADLTEVVLTDTPDPGLELSEGQTQITLNIGTLAPGKQRRVEYQAIAKLAGRLTNRAVVTAAGGLRREASSAVMVHEAKLAVTKAGPEESSPNLPTRYDITVRNPGTAVAGNVVLTDFLPPQVAFVSASAGGRLVGKDVQWALGNLPPGSQRTVQVVLRATTAGQVNYRVSATAARDVTAQTDAARTFFKGGTGLTASVYAADNPVELGKNTSYVITVVNQGNVPDKDLTLKVRVPEQMEVVRTEPAGARQTGQDITFETPTLQGGASAEYRIHVRTRQAGEAGLQLELNAASLLGGGPVKREARTTIFAEDNPPRPPAGAPMGGP